MTRPVPYPADTKAKGWRFELDHERIDQSDTWALATPALRPWLLMTWLVSWKQIPCGSLPADDELIAARLGMDLDQFAAAKKVLMRGWWLADDGRLYHDTVVEMVLSLIESRNMGAARKSAYDKKSKSIRERDGGACVYCGHTKYLSLDHLMPISRGGSGEDSNLVTCCRSCNSRKGARTPAEANMTFTNKNAELLWENHIERSGNALRKQSNAEERIADDTSTRTRTSTSTYIPEPGFSAHANADGDFLDGAEERAPEQPGDSGSDPSGIPKAPQVTGGPTPGQVTFAMKRAGLSNLSTSHPKLLALIAAGATVQEFVDAAQKAVDGGKGFAYALAVVEGQRREAAAMAGQLHTGPLPAKPPPQGESFRERDERMASERMAEFAPNAARKLSPPQPIEHPHNIIELEPPYALVHQGH